MGSSRGGISLEDALARYRALTEYASDLFFLVRADGGILDVNDGACRILGYSREELLRMSLSDVSDVTAGAWRKHVRRAVPGGSLSFEAMQLRRDGESFPVEVRGGSVESGGDLQLVLQARDVSAARRAEAELREHEEKLSKILAAAMDAIIVVDADLRVHLCNPAAERVFGCSPAEMGDQSFHRFLSPAFRDLLAEHVRCAAQESGPDRQVEAGAGVTGLRADGLDFPLEATISRVEASDEPLFLIILRDIGDRLKAEDQIRKLRMETEVLREVVKLHPGGLIGASAPMRKVFKDIETVAPTDYTVLIQGETGTGKELVARAVHQASARSGGVLVTVNCAALPPGLTESEFFGHERGAFTGALSRKPGRFEMADGGTIFLDEISATSLDVQTKLLRVLQEGEFERIGGTRTIRVDVRVIAASNKDLLQAVEEGAFRADLYYRLNVFPIRLAPLRDRKEDIPLLVRHFAARCGPKVGKEIERISGEVMDSLLSYEWPGNVRELQNVVERAVILSEGSELLLGDWFRGAGTVRELAAEGTLEEVQREHILKVLERTRWRVSGDRGAARILGLKPTTLESRMKRLGISRERQKFPK
jgi:formate hydrogenlyase transcriptional activator